MEGAYHYIEKTFNENPKLFYIVIGVVGGAAAALLVMPAVLGVAGFSGIGPVAGKIASLLFQTPSYTDYCIKGSMAACLQSAGWAGAAFSTVQSAAMGGYGLLAVAGIFTAVGAAVGGAVGATASFIVAACKKKKS